MKIESLTHGKKIAIYGIGRFQKDFEYVFDSLNPVYYIWDNYCESTYEDKPVYSTSEFKKIYNDDTLIIICDYDKTRAKFILSNFGLQCGVNYYEADDFFLTLDLDIKDLAGDRKIAIMGTGELAVSQLHYMQNTLCLNPAIFIERDKKNLSCIIEGLPVMNLASMKGKWSEYYVVIAEEPYCDCYEDLATAGPKEIDDFLYYKKLRYNPLILPSDMMRETIYAQSYDQPDCRVPFEFLHVGSRRVDLCYCPGFVNRLIAYNESDPFEKMWNCNAAKVFRLSVINKTHCFCKKEHCATMNPWAKPKEGRMANIPKLSEYPMTLHINLDSSCNLYCVSCRNKIRVCSGDDLKERKFMAEKLKNSGILENLEIFESSGDGETFFSELYQDILYYSPDGKKRKNLYICSNGILLNEANFQKIKASYERVKKIEISIDAASKETYEKLRRGGDWDKLLKNLKMIGGHLKNGEIDRFLINMCVQKENYKEIPDFIRLGESVNANSIYFSFIRNWGTYSAEEFCEISMQDSEGYMKPELEAIFDDPIFESEYAKRAVFNMHTFKNHRKPVLC